MTAEVEVVGIVVPARNEQDLLPAALRALDGAAQPVRRRGVVVDLLVVADSCTDATATVARSAAVDVLDVSVGAVGPARAAGFQALLRRHLGIPRDRFWLASTDADSIVPADWLTTHLDLARAGADVVIGAVHPRFADLAPDEIDWWHRTHDDGQALGNIHGANLGIAAAAYRRAGGFVALPEHEDTDLVRRLRLSGAFVVATERGMVETSGRHVGRTPGGYARYLREDLPRLAAVNPVT